GLAGLDMRLAYVVGVPVLRDHQDSDLDLAGRERATLVEIGADVLHPVRNRRRMDPHLVGAEDATAPGGDPDEHGPPLWRERLGRELCGAVYGERVRRMVTPSYTGLMFFGRVRSPAARPQ